MTATTAKRLSLPLIAIAFGLVTWVVIAQDTGSTPQTQGELGFRNARAISEPEGPNNEETFKLDVAWGGTSYPGVRECTLKAVDQHGRVVGQYTDTFSTMMPVSPISLAIPVASPAVDLRGDCGPRLDSGGAYAYQFSNVRVQAAQSDSYGPGTVRVIYDAQWLGTGKPGVVTCAVSVTDASGASLYSKPMNVVIASGQTNDEDLHLTDEALQAGQATGARFDCTPYEYKG